MPIPCEQNSNIVNMVKTLDRMERGMEKITTVLEKVASQEARLDSAESDNIKLYAAQNDIWQRIHIIEGKLASAIPELKIETHIALDEAKDAINQTLDEINTKINSILTFFQITTSRPAKVVYGIIVSMIVVGTGLDLMYHVDTIKALYYLVRG